MVVGIWVGARCNTELLREQVGQVNVLTPKQGLHRSVFLGRVGILLITYTGSWEVGWGGLQVAEVRGVVEEGGGGGGR